MQEALQSGRGSTVRQSPQVVQSFVWDSTIGLKGIGAYWVDVCGNKSGSHCGNATSVSIYRCQAILLDLARVFSEPVWVKGSWGPRLVCEKWNGGMKHDGNLWLSGTNIQLPLCLLQKPLGEQFRKEVHIRNLPSLFKKVKPLLETDILENEDGGGLTALFEP